MAVDWLVDVLRTAGLRVVEYPGWRTRAAPGGFAPRGVIWHHDASAPGPSPGMSLLIAEVGNATTPPPLSQAWVDTAGTWTVTAAGRANHAGTGTGWGRIRANRGNEDAIGVETDHTVGEAWPQPQLDSLRIGTAAILRRLGAVPGDALAGHLEYAPGRKIDPAGLDLTAERHRVADLMEDDMPLTTQDIDAIANRIFGAVLTPPGGAAGQTRTVRHLLEDIQGYGMRTVHTETLAAQIAAAVARLEARPLTDIDEGALAEALGPVLAPLIQAGATPAQVEDAVRRAFARAGQPEGSTTA